MDALVVDAQQPSSLVSWLLTQLSDRVTAATTTLCIPSYNEYRMAATTAGGDVLRAMITSGHFMVLTVRPLVLLFYWLGRLFLSGLYKVAGPAANQLFQQLQVLLRQYVDWQIHLTPRQLAIQAGVLVGLVLVHRLYKLLLRQTCTRRFKAWLVLQRVKARVVYAKGRDRVIKLYTDAVDHISRVSMVSAALIPHFLFVLLALSLCRLSPAATQYLATETMLTPCLSTLLPLIGSVLLIHDVRQQQAADAAARVGEGEGDVAAKTTSRSKTKTRQRGAADDNEKENTLQTPRVARRSFFARTHPSATGSDKKKNQQSTGSKKKRHGHTVDEACSLTERTQFWMDYWIVHAALQVSIATFHALPLLGRLFATLSRSYSPMLRTTELFVYIWFYMMPYLLVTNNDRLEGRPLPVLSRLFRPFVTKLVINVSSVVSPETWNTYIMAPASPFLQLSVTLRLVSPLSREILLHALQQAQQLVVPCVWLLLPLPSTSTLAVLYVQWVLPLYKSYHCRTGEVVAAGLNGKDQLPTAPQKKTPFQVLENKMPLPPQQDFPVADPSWSSLIILEYWVLHTLLNMFVNLFSSLLWWVPLVNVFLFAAWWYLSLTVTVTKWYRVVNRDLHLLGILVNHLDHVHDDDGEEENVPTLHRAFHWVLQRLPSAADRNVDDDDAGDADNNVDDDDNDLVQEEQMQSNIAQVAVDDEENDSVGDADDATLSNLSDDESDIRMYTGSYGKIHESEFLQSHTNDSDEDFVPTETSTLGGRRRSQRLARKS